MSNQDQQLSLFDILSVNQDPLQSPKSVDFDLEEIPQNAKTPIPPGTYQTLAQIADHCNRCDRCELGKNRTHAVIGRGNPTAPIMIIGEAPGQHEDEQGLPFVGRSGKLLDNILDSVGLSTDTEVYISNAIRCRPPENRTPTASELEACKPYLLEQIRLINPQIILLTGATAVKSILGDKRPITKIRGQWFQWEGRQCMPIFHPAYLLRNSSRDVGKPKWLMWQDMQVVRQRLNEIQSH
ncbi:MAG: uracil-DNA glycosylase [Arthrospira sp. SH-MAG29]|nr:uracil-DNA glycosylase [Arthrospira sp. SH-MAG29]MBS0018689.1 uracil-DNA glycosylase [Arthrospira sp. SH-MAG29]